MYSVHPESPSSMNTIQSFMAGIYGWMGCALSITALTAYSVASRPEFLLYIQAHPFILMLLFIGQLGLVIALSAALHKMSFSTALVLFMLYAIMMGITLSSIFIIYTTASIVGTFVTTAGMFAAMSVYGYLTKADLTGIGSLSMMMLIGLIIATLVNMFVQSSTFDLIISGIGVIIFTLLTAYDVQKLKQIGQRLASDNETIAKITIIGALTLYLDFINLFLYMLRFMGNRRAN